MDHQLCADHHLACRLERLEATACANFVDARIQATAGTQACWRQFEGTYAMFDTPDSPITQTFGLGMFEPVTDALLAEIEDFFFTRGAAVNHEVSPLAGVDVYARLASRGYQPVELTSVMYRPAAEPLRLPTNPQVSVRVVKPAEHEIWAEVLARGWAAEMPGGAELMLGFGKMIAAKSDTVAFLAAWNGKPAAGGALSISGGAALLAGASTVPEARRNGAQTALLDARLRYAAQHGCDLAMMCAAAGSSSQRNAQRNGFHIAYTRVKWSRPLKSA